MLFTYLQIVFAFEQFPDIYNLIRILDFENRVYLR